MKYFTYCSMCDKVRNVQASKSYLVDKLCIQCKGQLFICNISRRHDCSCCDVRYICFTESREIDLWLHEIKTFFGVTTSATWTSSKR